MANLPKTGPLTQAELQTIWESATDPSYWRPFELAGEGNGFEAYTQAWVQFARVSLAVNRSLQAMYILPWSGQSDQPASGAARATVELTFTRTLRLGEPLILSAGTLVEEQQTDWGTPEGVLVQTGRRYALDVDLTFEPGQPGPLTVQATAERPGYGYNNPLPGTLTLVDQVGTGFTNIDGTVRGVNYPSGFVGTNFVQAVYLDAIDFPDAFLPDHVGQYIQFGAGANTGLIARIVAWQSPNLAAVPPTGGTVQLELSQSIESFAGNFSGSFQPGEPLTLKNGATVTGYGRMVDARVVGGNLLTTFVRVCGYAVTTVVGQISGASATIGIVFGQHDYTPEGLAATWTVLDWSKDWGVAVTNVLSPVGGKSAMLDVLGAERAISRSSNEDDAHYRQRIAQVPDVVSPNAIRRTLNRTIPNLPWCFRETGQANYPGFFLDHDFYDLDMVRFSGAVTGQFFSGEKVSQAGAPITFGRACTTYTVPATVPAPLTGPTLYGVANAIPVGGFVTGTPVVGSESGASVTPSTIQQATGGINATDRYRLLFGYLEMRAYFYVGVPPLELGDDGFAYDTHPHGAYDAYPNPYGFYDGAPWADSQTYGNVFDAVDRVRAAGVGWQLYLETGPCP